MTELTADDPHLTRSITIDDLRVLNSNKVKNNIYQRVKSTQPMLVEEAFCLLLGIEKLRISKYTDINVKNLLSVLVK